MRLISPVSTTDIPSHNLEWDADAGDDAGAGAGAAAGGGLTAVGAFAADRAADAAEVEMVAAAGFGPFLAEEGDVVVFDFAGDLAEGIF